MICVLKIVDGKVSGWILATDTHEARRKAEGALLPDLAQALYRMEFPQRGKHDLPGGYVMLVD